MKLKYYLTALSLLFVMQQGCRNASFENIDPKKLVTVDSGNDDAIPEEVEEEEEEEEETTPVETPVQNTVKPTLTVTTPSNEIKAGEEKMPATATLSSQTAPPVVKWTITGPVGKTDIGSIDQNGIYTSPKTNDKEFPITIQATLISDPTIFGTKPIMVLPVTQIFARCTKGNAIFPILAHVYSVPMKTTKLPDYTNPNEATKVLTVCMDKYAVAPRNFDTGFPDVPNLFEFFSLQTTTSLVIPMDGDYTFQLNSDDGSKMRIDGTVVIDNDGLHQAFGTDPLDTSIELTGQKTKTIRLTKGEHALSLDYFQGPKFRIALELKWKTPGATNFVYIPTESFK